MPRARKTPPERFERRDWTEEETERFARLYPTSTAIELVRAFARSETALHQKACRLGLSKPRASAPAAQKAPAKTPDLPSCGAHIAANILGTTRTARGMKTVYRTPAGGTVTRHTMK